LGSELPHYGVGKFAVYKGKTYRAYGNPSAADIAIRVAEGEPAPTGLAPDPKEPERLYRVSPEQLDSWYSSSWTFRWKDWLFSSYGVHDGKISGLCLGLRRGGTGSIDAAPFQRVGATEYEGTFSIDEVADLTEERSDLLEEWKARHRD